MGGQELALTLAGIVGCGVAVVHGLLTQRLMATPVDRLAGPRLPAPVRRLIPALLQFSTFNWFVSGLALIFLDGEARVAAAWLAGSSYLYGAVGNLWGTRALHPGWVLYAIAVALIVYGVS